MPTKPIGPASDTAALVASDALTNASRCARGDVDAARRGRVGADAQQVQRRRQHGEHRERDGDHSGSAPSIGSKPPTSRSPISQRDAR